MITVLIPVIEKADTLIPGDGIQKATDFGIAVNRHLLREERMIECEIRIVLAGIIFFYNQICDKIQNKTGVCSKPLAEHGTEFIFIDRFLDDDIGADLQAAASVCKRQFFREFHIREVNLELLVRKHQGGIYRRNLPDNRPLRDSIPLDRIVFAPVLIKDIGYAAFLFGYNLALYFRYFD